MTKPTTLSTIFRTVTAATAAAVLLSGCSRAVIKPANESAPIPTNEYQYQHELNMIDDNYRNYYQIFVYSFCDSNGDGIGDLNGVTSKLDYIQDMGFNGIWLTPIMSSSSYHKYSVDDYYSIDPQYGTMDDFQNLADECSKRGIKLLIDLVMNHTSRDNEWFASAAESLRQQPCGADKEQECLSKTLCPVHNPYVDRGAAVERQLDDPDSILNYYKRALRIRNENPCIARGKTHVINITGQDVAAVRRTWEDESVVIVYNYSEEEKSINDELLSLDTLEIRGYLTVSSDQSVELDGELTMPPYSIVFLTNK